MVRVDEEARALISRQQTRRQARARVARNAALRGTNAAAQAIRDDWESVILARREAGEERDNDE